MSTRGQIAVQVVAELPRQHAQFVFAVVTVMGQGNRVYDLGALCPQRSHHGIEEGATAIVLTADAAHDTQTHTLETGVLQSRCKAAVLRSMRCSAGGDAVRGVITSQYIQQ